LCKRAKLRGSPKALITKVVRETLRPAPLMTGGRVISSEMHERKWVIVDLNQTASVKEQRVDGSSVSMDAVRGTLAAGKAGF
jgi:hypothetical protein